MTATSPTAPSAAEAGRCSCAATTTAVGQYAADDLGIRARHQSRVGGSLEWTSAETAASPFMANWEK